MIIPEITSIFYSPALLNNFPPKQPTVTSIFSIHHSPQAISSV